MRTDLANDRIKRGTCVLSEYYKVTVYVVSVGEVYWVRIGNFKTGPKEASLEIQRWQNSKVEFNRGQEFILEQYKS